MQDKIKGFLLENCYVILIKYSFVPIVLCRNKLLAHAQFHMQCTVLLEVFF